MSQCIAKFEFEEEAPIKEIARIFAAALVRSRKRKEAQQERGCSQADN